MEGMMPDDAMNVTRKPAMKVGHASEKKPVMVAGRRDFFAYRDLGIGEASGGQMRGQVMKAITGMTQPTGWHYHTCDGQFVYALKGRVELEFETGETLRLEPGDSVFIPARVPPRLRRMLSLGSEPGADFGRTVPQIGQHAV